MQWYLLSYRKINLVCVITIPHSLNCSFQTTTILLDTTQTHENTLLHTSNKNDALLLIQNNITEEKEWLRPYRKFFARLTFINICSLLTLLPINLTTWSNRQYANSLRRTRTLLSWENSKRNRQKSEKPRSWSSRCSK